MNKKVNPDQLPAPLVPADVDLRGFSFVPVEIERLRRSKSWLIAKRKPAVGFFMFNLWMGVWHSVPAGSLEDDDDIIADMAGCIDLELWAAVREDVLRGWIKCSDGRLYHPVVSEKALEAWERVRAQHKRTAAATEARKRKAREAAAAAPDGAGDDDPPTEPAPSSPGPNKPRPAKDAAAPGISTATEHATATSRKPDVHQETGQERTGQETPPPQTPPPAKQRSSRATPAAMAVVDAFIAAKDARWPEYAEQIAPRMTMEALAQQHLDAGGTVDLLTELIQRAVRDWKNPTPPTSLAALKNSLADRIAQHRRALEGGGQRAMPANDAPDRPFDPHEQSRVRLRNWLRTGRWHSHWGPEPGHSMCQIPKAVVLEEIPGFKPGWRPPLAGTDKGAA